MNGSEGIVLVEVDRRMNIARNQVVVDADAIDLNCEQDRDAHRLEIASCGDGRGASPALAEQDHAGCCYFFRV
jgi:hypothetical protein